MSKIEYKELIAFHPGYYIKELIEEMGMSQEELAKRLQTNGKYISDLLNGRINLTDEMVLKLATVFGTSTGLWLNLNKAFIEKKLAIEKRLKEDEEGRLAKKIDYKFWAELGLVETTRSASEKARELQRYLKIASLSVLQKKDFLVQYSTSISEINDVNIINANAWVQTAINIGANMQVGIFDKKKLSGFVLEMRKMTTQDPEVFVPRLKDMFRECGVAFVMIPGLKNCGVNGAVKWISREKVILALNNCEKDADDFWFSLFHEVGHVMQQRIKILSVSDRDEANYLKTDSTIQKLEQQADEYSKNILIPESDYLRFINTTKTFQEKVIIDFANDLGIHPGNVVRRLQNDKILPKKTGLNNLKVKYNLQKVPV